MSDKAKILGVDLTTIGATVPLPENLDDPIYDYPDPNSLPNVDIPYAELVIKVYILETRLARLEQWLKDQNFSKLYERQNYGG
ncbi:MAG: hypothetical protein KGL39_36505 [Patescibacteria group bacterium]|nr:hypothetical protein [Patescibacteria group bacterium]